MVETSMSSSELEVEDGGMIEREIGGQIHYQ